MLRKVSEKERMDQQMIVKNVIINQITCVYL